MEGSTVLLAECPTPRPDLSSAHPLTQASQQPFTVQRNLESTNPDFPHLLRPCSGYPASPNPRPWARGQTPSYPTPSAEQDSAGTYRRCWCVHCRSL